MDVIRLKIEPPAKFTGKENYDEFAKRFTNYVSLSDHHYATVMKWATEQGDEITTQELDALDPDDKKGLATKCVHGALLRSHRTS